MSGSKLKIAAVVSLVLLLGLAGGYLLGKSPAEKSAGKTLQTKQLYSCGMHPNVIQEGPGNCPICGMKLTPLRSSSGGERKIKSWKSSMDPNFISDKPGKDNMGMDLVPVYEDETAEGTIAVDPVTVQSMGLRKATVEMRQLSKSIRTVGHIDYNEELLYTVSTKISGWIEKLYANKTGEEVQKGEPLLEIYSPELVSSQQEYLTAYRNYQGFKKSTYDEARQGAVELWMASKRRLSNWDITPQQIAHLEQTGEAKKTLTIFSPARGIITEKNVTAGARIEAGLDLFKIADISRVWILAHIFEYELPFVKVGQEAVIESPYLPGEKLEGKLTYIYPYLDEMTRDIKVRIEVPNPKGKLKPQMYANVLISSKLPHPSLVVPEEAVLRTGKREIVFVDLGEGKFVPREVVTGVRGDNLVEIKEGLKAGEEVVSSGQFLLDSESKTQEAIKKMMQEKPSAKAVSSASAKQVAPQPVEKSPPAKNSNLTKDKKAHSAKEVYTCPMQEHSHILQVGPGECPECGMELVPVPETGRTVYTCPMEEHHHVLSDQPGKCPECGMELVPLKSKAK